MRHRFIALITTFWGVINCFGQDVKLKLTRPINYDENKVAPYVLPNILLCEDGTIVNTSKQWERKRRPEILQLFSTYMYGKVPNMEESSKWEVIKTKSNALDGHAIRRDIKVWPLASHHDYSIDVQIYLPHSSKRQPVPLFLAIALLPNYTVCLDSDLEKPDSILMANGQRSKAVKRGDKKDFWQVEKILAEGYGIAIFCHQDISPDTPTDFYKSLPSMFYKTGQSYPAPDEWGAISMWAWQMSRVMDYIVNDDLIDKEKVIAIGHSRFGKTALWAAVQDKRFAMAVANNAGCGGTAISKRRFGETIEAINQRFPHWFCSNFKQFNNREEYMPFDQHELVALMAPRPVYIASAEQDDWSDQKGEFLAGKEASTVYHLYGLNGLECDSIPAVEHPKSTGYIGYHIRRGKHTMTAYDWDQYLKFANMHFIKETK
jgi:hypothetical protein